ncbi:glycosyltransferase family 2 protein [Oceanibaculum nanhaiense]|uniref:glycosyltransferase family 2 protein n=1 Tax=Oceanibaculum nanhaiense TaxID=1909734 RepID=UPI003D2A73E1
MTARPSDYTISCIVPVHNEGPDILGFLRQLHGLLKKQTSRFEIVLVDDGSTDDSLFAVAAEAEALGLVLVRFSRNFGKEAAMTAGLQKARGDVVIIIDADLQEPMEVIPQMLEHWHAGYDMIYAVRDSRKDETLLKRIGVRLFYYLMAQGNSTEVPPDARDFRLMDRKVVAALNQLPERNRFMKGLFSWVGFRSLAIPVRIAPRRIGRSSFSFLRLAELALTGITSFSNVPLRIWGGIGFVISLMAFLFALYTIVKTLVFGADVPGFPTIVVSIMFFTGIQLLSIGILGEYISRVFIEVKQRPHYLIAEEIDRSPLRDPAA